jgi:C4-dicarboxylate-specific signal transduction histidine kinase
MSQDRSKQTILAVDDTELNVDILMGILKKYDMIPALSAKDALEILEEESVDLILLDIVMPDMDGYELCKILKENPKTKDIPIIFITVKTTGEDVKKGFDLGAVDYVTKPFNPSELLARVNTHLELKEYQKSLQKKVDEALENARQNEQILHQQSKQAAIGELIMNISHQWRQPLTQLKALTALNIMKLDDGENLSSEELRESFEKMEKTITFMKNTVDTFEDFYRPSSKKDSFFIHMAIEDTQGIVEGTFKNHGVELIVDIKDEIEIFASKNEYSQVLLNILTNAKDMLVKNKIENPKVYITASKNEGKSEVKICDNAGGIDDAIMQKMFQPFNSGKNSSGLGLYMSKSIMNKNGGKLEATNTPEGACFTIVL